MDTHTLRQVPQQVSNGSLSVEEAILQFKVAPFQDLGFAKVDHHRSLRNGVAEEIYGAGLSSQLQG